MSGLSGVSDMVALAPPVVGEIVTKGRKSDCGRAQSDEPETTGLAASSQTDFHAKSSMMVGRFKFSSSCVQPQFIPVCAVGTFVIQLRNSRDERAAGSKLQISRRKIREGERDKKSAERTKEAKVSRESTGEVSKRRGG